MTIVGATAGDSNIALAKLRVMLRDRIDAKLPTEREMAETFNVSRRAVRRALEVLEAEGVIWRKQGAGTYAGQRPDKLEAQVDSILADTDFMEVMEVRMRIEPQLAQLAAVRAKPDDVRRMYDLIDRISEGEDADDHELWDGAFHRQIALCAGNRFFLALFDVINRVRQDSAWLAIRERARGGSDVRPLMHAQHRAIVEAIEARDPGRAAEAMRRHLFTLQENLIRVTSFDRHDEQAG